MTDHSAITIRFARPTDEPSLVRLAELDSSPALAAPTLVAFADGEPSAALSLVDGRSVADPFQPTAGVVALLRERAGSTRPARARHGRALGLRPRAV